MSDNDNKDQKALGNSIKDAGFLDSNARKNKDTKMEAREASVEISRKKQTADYAANIRDEPKTANGFGHLLRAERLKRGLSVGEVSRRLRLSAQQINAIEEEDYSKLPSGTFLRGYVRNYGSLLQLDTEVLLQLMAQTAPASAYQSPAKQVKTIPLVSSKKRGGKGRSFSFLVIVIVLALLGYGLHHEGDIGQKSALKNESDVDITFESRAESGQVTMELLLPQVPSMPEELPSKLESQEKSASDIGTAPSISKVDEPVVTETEAVETSEKTLHFVFSRDSWVEIRDEDKKIIYVKTNPKNTEQVIQGTPPFYLVVGNASGVNLTYNGKLVDLTPYIRKSDDVARFSLE